MFPNARSTPQDPLKDDTSKTQHKLGAYGLILIGKK